MAMQGIVKDRVFDILNAHPEYADSTKSIALEYKELFGKTVGRTQVKRICREWALQHQQAAPVEEDGRYSVAVTSDENVPSSEIVPDRLLENIGHVTEAMFAAGGIDNALAVARAIQAVGGAENFARCMTLVQVVTNNTNRNSS